MTSFCYDSANRLVTSTDPALKVTSYEYNARSQMTAVVDAINQRYEFVYDALGRLTQEKKGTPTKSFLYDAVGNRTQRTDFNGAITNYTFDALNRLTTIGYPDATSATYGYDVLSRLTTATNPNGTVTIGYDNRGRVSSVTDVFGQAVAYAYDANSNRTQLSLNGGPSATYQYDVLNRLTQLADAASLNTTFGYDATNKLTARNLPNGVATNYQYDGLDRLTRLTHSKGANTLTDFQYQFNAVNNITQMIDSSGTQSFTYDSVDRLTSATHTGQANESYSYDPVGNRTASQQGSSYSYQPFNRLVIANGTSYGYDANGDVTSKTDASGSWTCAWDYENRLKQASLSGGVVVNYSYDALGRRIQRSDSNGGTSKFVYDGADVVRDLNANLSTAADYLNGPGIDNKLRQTVGGTASYFVQDHLGTTRGFADASGNGTSSLSYDSFGSVTNGSPSTRYTYTGRESDPDTGLMYYRARSYDPEKGRFVGEDPIGFKGGDINLYAYVKNNPNRFKDPSGRDIYAISGGGSASIGLGDGGAISGSYLVGLNFTPCGVSFGGAGSFGGFFGTASGLGFPDDKGFAIGGGANAGPGIVYSNASSFSELTGPFDVTQYNFFVVTLEIDESIPRHTYVWSLSGGKGLAVGITRLQTYTPSWSIFETRTKCTCSEPLPISRNGLPLPIPAPAPTPTPRP